MKELFLSGIAWQAGLFFLLGAGLLGLSGISGQVAVDKWNEWRDFKNYDYKYFENQIEFEAKTPQEVETFLNKLDLAKRNADRSIENQLKKREDLERIRQINDYTFKVFRDFWFAQTKWFAKNGRYFQGKKTMQEPPSFLKNRKVEHRFGLTDQVDDWLDISYKEKYAPVQLECHVYKAPSGHGFVIWAKFIYDKTVWSNQMHVGVESERSKNNFVWQKQTV